MFKLKKKRRTSYVYVVVMETGLQLSNGPTEMTAQVDEIYYDKKKADNRKQEIINNGVSLPLILGDVYVVRRIISR